ncbi:hypothetical protein CPB83DRAFT_936943, partial [Crepidotus variabilis]
TAAVANAVTSISATPSTPKSTSEHSSDESTDSLTSSAASTKFQIEKSRRQTFDKAVQIFTKYQEYTNLLDGPDGSDLSMLQRSRIRQALKQSLAILNLDSELPESNVVAHSKEEITQALDTCLLGYATVNMATLDDFSRGPVLARQMLNHRPIMKKGTQSLKQMRQTGSLHQTSTVESYLIKLMVYRKALVVDKLAKSSQLSPYPLIPWVKNVKSLKVPAGLDYIAGVGDGNHRLEETMQAAKLYITQYEKLRCEMEEQKD